MHVCQTGYCFHLDQNVVFYNDICDIFTNNNPIEQYCNWHLLIDMKTRFSASMSQSIFINLLQKTTTQNILNLKCTSNHRFGNALQLGIPRP